MIFLFAALCIARLWRAESIFTCLGVGTWPLACLCLFALWLALQWSGVIPGLETADAFNTLQYLLATLTYVAAFSLVLLLVKSSAHVRWLMAVILASGVSQALIAIGLFASRATYIFLFMPFTQGTRATGTFANFDHLAGYMELCIPAGVGLMLAHMGSGENKTLNRREHMVNVLKFMMSGKMLVRLMLVIMVIALVLTRSRMGSVAFFTSMLVIGGIAMLRNPRLRIAAFWLILSLIVIDVVVIGQWVGIDHVVERLQNTALDNEHARGEETVEQRSQTPRQAFGMVIERPLSGFGAGSFYTVFPRFKSADKNSFWDHAHNDYVQLAAETGLVGLGLLATMVLMTIARILILWKEHEPRINRGVAFGVAMAICALLIHSWVDFNLQIPANALVFCVLLAVVWVLVPHTAATKEVINDIG
ncbi:O-antigen ligase family protein [Uliginosibacterium gangwonense]|uniref:O-antigen ligase family protein n=1 Tax=Uliginosibacterium gangwonense TaxID=392736 RepID=UPI000475A2FB|nr:O-antigen ligase family protein [Uliginosibacterium gangwonense]